MQLQNIVMLLLMKALEQLSARNWVMDRDFSARVKREGIYRGMIM